MKQGKIKFEVRNSTQSEIHIKTAENCSCISPATIPPGKSSTIALQVNPDAFSEGFNIFYADNGQYISKILAVKNAESSEKSSREKSTNYNFKLNMPYERTISSSGSGKVTWDNGMQINIEKAACSKQNAVSEILLNVIPSSPELIIENPSFAKITEAFRLALWTIDYNTTPDNILKAGAEYGGEWTRDIGMSTWNGVSLLRPDTAVKSLWSVTYDKTIVVHQYWDKIVWAQGAWSYYLATLDKEFLKQAYICLDNTIHELSSVVSFDRASGLFKGPSNLNDGIAGYDSPPYDKTNGSSYILDYPGAESIRCLSTNVLYFGGYDVMLKMAGVLDEKHEKINSLKNKRDTLKKNIIKHFWLKDKKRLAYVINPDGTKDESQEGLGVGYALLFNILSEKDSKALIKNINLEKHGIADVWPDYKRFSIKKQGRHNNIVWPVISGYWADGAVRHEAYDVFEFELRNQADLALYNDKSAEIDMLRGPNFREIYNRETGQPDGGWQDMGDAGIKQWHSTHHQTWSATAYTRMILFGLIGLNPSTDGLHFSPFIPRNYGQVSLTGLKYRDTVLDMSIAGSGNKIKSFKIDGKEHDNIVTPNLKGRHTVEISLSV